MMDMALLLDITDMTEPIYQALLPSLSEKRKQYIERFHPAIERYQHLGVSLLAAYALRMIGLSSDRLRFAADGKPFLISDNAVYISLSHSANYCCCAISEAPVGIDIQHFERCPSQLIAKHFYTGEECAYLRSLPPQEQQRAFYTLWSRKECRVKLFTGEQLRASSAMSCPEQYIYCDFTLPNASLSILGTLEHCPSKYTRLSLAQIIKKES